MDWLKKHQPVVRSAAGWEWRIFKKIHWFWFAGFVLLPGLGLMGRAYAGWVEMPRSQEWIMQMDFFLWGFFFFYISMMIALTVGCVLVIIMKGPRYSADSYPVPDEEPLSQRSDLLIR